MKRSSIERLFNDYYEEPTTGSEGVQSDEEDRIEIRQDVFDEGLADASSTDFQISLEDEEEELQGDTAAFSRFFSAALSNDVDVRRIVRTFFSSKEAGAYRTGLGKKSNNR